MVKAAEVVLQLRAENAQYLAKLRQSETQFSRYLGGIQRQAGATGAFLKTTFAGLFAGASVAALQNLSDAATRIDNALKVAGLSGAELEKIYGRLRASAMENAAPIEDLVTLYSRASMAAANLGASQDDLDKFVNNVALSLRVSGKSASEASGALLQLSQVLGGSVVQAQEYNSLIDGAYPLLQAVAAGLKEAGGDVGKLTQLVKSGEVPTKAFFDAFQAGSVVLEEKVASSQFTVSQALGNLQTSLIDTVREFNKATGAGEKMATGVNNLAREISNLDVEGFVARISEARTAVEQFLGSIGSSDAMERFAEFLTGTELTKGAPVSMETAEAEKRLEGLKYQIEIVTQLIEHNKEMSIDTSGAQAELADLLKQAQAVSATLAGGAAAGDAVRQQINGMVPLNSLPPLTTKPKPVSLTDYDAPGGDKKKNKSTNKKTADDRFQDDIQSVRDRTAALIAEREALGLSFEEQQKRAVSLDLEQETLRQVREEARRKGEQDWQNAKLSPEQVAAINEVSAAYAKQAEIMRQVQEAMDLERDVLKGAFGDLRSSLQDGKITTEEWFNAFLNGLDKVIDKIEDDLIDAITKASNSGGGGGGWLGKIFGAIFGGGLNVFPGGGGLNSTGGLYASGGYTGPGGKNQPAGIVHKGEVVWSQDDIRRAGGLAVVEAARRMGGLPGYSNGGPVTMPSIPAIPKLMTGASTRNSTPAYHDNRQFNIDARGAQQGVGAEIRKALEEYDRKQAPETWNRINNDRRVR